MKQETLDRIEALTKRTRWFAKDDKAHVLAITEEINKLVQDCDHKYPDGNTAINKDENYCKLCGQEDLWL